MRQPAVSDNILIFLKLGTPIWQNIWETNVIGNVNSTEWRTFCPRTPTFLQNRWSHVVWTRDVSCSSHCVHQMRSR